MHVGALIIIKLKPMVQCLQPYNDALFAPTACNKPTVINVKAVGLSPER